MMPSITGNIGLDAEFWVDVINLDQQPLGLSSIMWVALIEATEGLKNNCIEEFLEWKMTLKKTCLSIQAPV